MLGFAWLSVLVAIGLITYAVAKSDPRFYFGAGFFAAALVYWRAVVWVDRNGTWT